jgi:hypothetical protein
LTDVAQLAERSHESAQEHEGKRKTENNKHFEQHLNLQSGHNNARTIDLAAANDNDFLAFAPSYSLHTTTRSNIFGGVAPGR